MKTSIYLAAAQVPDLKIETGVTWLKGLVVSLIVVALLWMALQGFRSHGTDGNYKQAGGMFITALILCGLVAMAASVTVISGYGGAMLGIFTGIFS